MIELSFSFFSFLGELHISISFDYSIDQHTCVTFILTGGNWVAANSRRFIKASQKKKQNVNAHTLIPKHKTHIFTTN